MQYVALVYVYIGTLCTLCVRSVYLCVLCVLHYTVPLVDALHLLARSIAPIWSPHLCRSPGAPTLRRCLLLFNLLRSLRRPRVHVFGNVQKTLAVLECLCDQLRFPITRAREYILRYRDSLDLLTLGSEDLRDLLPFGHLLRVPALARWSVLSYTVCLVVACVLLCCTLCSTLH